VVHGFAESIRVIWLVLIPFVRPFLFSADAEPIDEKCAKCGVGFIASMCMKALPLESVTDEVSAQELNIGHI
jgi:hypothetical protein